jgi:hypothetical protein
MLSDLHPHDRDGCITFVADTHVYYIKGVASMGRAARPLPVAETLVQLEQRDGRCRISPRRGPSGSRCLTAYEVIMAAPKSSFCCVVAQCVITALARS